MSSILVGHLLFAITLLSFMSGGLNAQNNTGMISGVVLNEDGIPVIAAEVDADQVDVAGTSKAIRLAMTDSAGSFRFAPVKFDAYRIFALKPEIGYPDTKFEMYREQYHSVTISVSAAKPEPFVTVMIGPKSGIVRPIVLAKDTLQPVPNPTFLLRRVDNAVWVSAALSMDSSILLPPMIEVELTVEAEGFKPLTKGDPQHPASGSPLKLKSGEELPITIVLERLSNP